MSWTDIILRLGAATIAGAMIGLNRELHHKSAGFRTLGIVALGVALSVLIGISTSSDQAAASRVIQGALTGIGFLGAGVIIRPLHTQGEISGLTTAAAVWTTAAIGAACGLGAWKEMITATALILLLLAFGGWIETWARQRSAHRPQEVKPDADKAIFK